MCDSCFDAAIRRLCEDIEKSSPEGLDATFFAGMAALNAGGEAMAIIDEYHVGGDGQDLGTPLGICLEDDEPIIVIPEDN